VGIPEGHFIGFHEGASARAESVRVNDLVDSVMTMLQYALGEKIKLTVDLDERVDALRARAQGLELPIAHLVLRARNAMQGEGALNVYTSMTDRHIAELGRAFERKYGVKVNAWRAGS